MKLEITGLDKLDKMVENSKKLTDKNLEIPISEIITENLHKFTYFSNLNELIEKRGYDFEEFGENKDIDDFIVLNSTFSHGMSYLVKQ